MAVGSDVGPFPHGTQAREFSLMVKYGMTPLAALRAGLLNGAKLLAGLIKSAPSNPAILLHHCRARRSTHRHQRPAKSHFRNEGRDCLSSRSLIRNAQDFAGSRLAPHALATLSVGHDAIEFCKRLGTLLSNLRACIFVFVRLQ